MSRQLHSLQLCSMAKSASPSLVCEGPSPQPSTPCAILQLCGTCGSRSTATHDYQKRESVVIAPGYTLSRTKSNISVSLCDEFFNRPKPVRTYVSRPAPEKDMEQLIKDLQEQITQLVQLLEEESYKQMAMERKFQNKNEQARLLLEKKYEEHMSETAANHALEVQAMKEKFEESMVEIKMDAEKQYAELKGELDSTQAAFMSYKESIIEEMNESWAQREAEMNKQFEADKRMELSLQENTLKKKCDQEKKLIEEQFQKQITSMLEEHNIEMEDLQEQLEKKTEELQYQTEHLSHVKERLQATEAKLTEFEGLYKTDISSLQRKYLSSIEVLENQNMDLKQLFALKAEELCVLKAKIEEQERIQKLQMRASLRVTLQE
ncbi:flagellum-associated coiled-coil domain-containing protein 1-like isoform X3 [Hypanus sabinus]|uniref:flagellum-associated coiled-coil domain-containing protein 1-like isoform X3 n=1 Tax=Hypanus sabinus TaxID=79690 RepID=UPI0028C3A0F5|nr:flagellum-associated coiled-coil domain-containing protein 1-like isoform X3 [Hypanus sabinus]